MKIDRLNIIILLAFPIFTLGALKLINSVLPAKYYFSISKLAKGADEPFIVEPPGVTEIKFCDLLKKYRVQPNEVSLPYIDCRRVYSDAKPESATYKPSAEEKDKIYRIAFQADGNAIGFAGTDTRSMRREILSEEQLDSILSQATSPTSAFDALAAHYASEFQNLAIDDNSKLVSYFKTAFQSLESADRTQGDASGESAAGAGPTLRLSQTEIQQIKAAHQRFANAFMRQDFSGALKSITIHDIENIIRQAYSPSDVSRQFASFYIGQTDPAVRQLLKNSFAESHVSLADTGKIRKEIMTEATEAGVSTYIISALIRIAPVLLVAILFGIAFGRREVFSTAFASGILAFLLVWPILLLWDTVVQSQWSGYKPLFIGLYSLYVLAFFAVGRTGALIGAGLSQKFGLHSMLGRGGDALEASGHIQFREIAVSLISSGALSALAFALNLIVPLHT